jgi:hypothetical protein
MIEFCRLYNVKYIGYGDKSNLNYLLQLLESAEQNPKNFREISQLFKEVIADVESGRHRSIVF